MKKIIFSTAIFFAISQINNHAKSQSLVQTIKEKLTIGIKADGNYSNFIVKDNNALKSKMGPGGRFGASMRFDISNHFAIQEDILFAYYTTDIERNNIKDKFEFMGMDVPFYFMGQWKNATNGRLFAGVGPYVSMGLKGKYKNDDLDVFKKYNDQKSEMNRIVAGGAAILGYELSNDIQFNVSYRYGMNMINKDKSNYKLSPQSISVGLGYNF